MIWEGVSRDDAALLVPGPSYYLDPYHPLLIVLEACRLDKLTPYYTRLGAKLPCNTCCLSLCNARWKTYVS